MSNIKAIFDIGNDSIKAVVFQNDENDGKTQILAKHIEPTRGLRKGKILESEEFTRCINNIIENFVKKLGADYIDEVYVGVSHPESMVKRISEQKRIMTDEITTNDVNHLSKIIADIAVENNMETVKIVPVNWVIDGEKKEKDPIGLKGKKLELVADAFMLPKNFYNGIIEAFSNVGLTISDIIPNILSASEIVLDYDHRDLGTILIDIGKNQTSYTVYEDGYPQCYGTIPVGGENVTKDISIGMQVDIKDAEDIKKTHGTAIIDKTNLENTALDSHFLTEIISSRYEAIFEKINNHLKLLDKDGRLAGGVILIGGGSKLPNLDLLAKDVFKLATTPGKDTTLNLGDISSNIQFTNVLGTFVRASKYNGGGGGLGTGLDMKKIWDKTKNFFKDLF